MQETSGAEVAPLSCTVPTSLQASLLAALESDKGVRHGRVAGALQSAYPKDPLEPKLPIELLGLLPWIDSDPEKVAVLGFQFAKSRGFVNSKERLTIGEAFEDPSVLMHVKADSALEFFEHADKGSNSRGAKTVEKTLLANPELAIAGYIVRRSPYTLDPERFGLLRGLTRLTIRQAIDPQSTEADLRKAAAAVAKLKGSLNRVECSRFLAAFQAALESDGVSEERRELILGIFRNAPAEPRKLAVEKAMIR